MPEATEAAPAVVPTPAPAAEPAKVPVVEYKPRLYKGHDLNKIFGQETAPETPAPAAEAAPAVAPVPTLPKVEPKKPDSVAKGFAELSKLEAKHRAEATAREATLKEREMKLAEKEAALQNMLEDPLGHLEKLGVTYETLTEQLLNGKKAPADLKQRAEIEKLKQAVKAQQEADAKREAERVAAEAKANEDRLLSEFRGRISETVKAGGDAFELITTLGREDLVFDVIDAHARKTGEVLEIAEAAAKVEEHLLEEEAGKARRLLQTKKLGETLRPVAAPQPSSGGQSATSGPKPKTLTASAAAPQSVSSTPLTEAEKRARAIAILKSGEPAQP